MGFLWYVQTLLLVATLVREGLTESNLASNPSALLKPLTPIADTNLFLNTPYKWHDHTKPGCYATWDHNMIIVSIFHGRVTMMCNRDDQKWYDTPDADWIFERTEGEESIDEYNGNLQIRNVGFGHNLYVELSNEGAWQNQRLVLSPKVSSFLPLVVSPTMFSFLPTDRLFSARSDPSDKNHVQIKFFNLFLAQDSITSNHRYDIRLQNDKPTYYPYSFVPAIKIEAIMNNFQFTRPFDEELAKHTSKKGLIDAYTITNDSPGTLSRQVTVSERVVNEFSWGFSESLKVFSKVTAKAGIPLIADAEVEAGFEAELGANQDWKNSVEKTFEMSYDVSVPPNSQVRISAWYDLIKDVSMDYTATTEIIGKTSRITVFDDIVQDSPATGEMIRNHLDYSNFDGEIVEIKKNSVIAKIKGTMTASVGVRGRLDVNGDTVRTKA